jgi:hypothetical protein
MRILRKLVLAISAGTVALYAAAFAVHLLITTPEEREFRRQFSTIAPGMSRDAVVGLLGQPHDEGPTFRLSQRDGFEEVYERARASASRYYLFWSQETDLTYAIGFDDRDQVRSKAVGGT